uniref:RNA polymerase sigma-70 domain-containing protein n=3 Tax=Rhodosorus marinus TaxID=101924 RepID=A0A7S2ZAG5_9RHOD|mmetsp:Transcript_11508/g.47890  ORF Transcript_11508/g.47890 Transcript_11508/m.47890 type:complete len:336 (+) Transcript_11508:376-1383(+)
MGFVVCAAARIGSGKRKISRRQQRHELKPRTKPIIRRTDENSKDVPLEAELTMAVQKMLAIEKLKRSLWESTGREPTLLEVAKIRNTDVDTISRYLDEGRKSRHALVEENLRLVSSIACRFVGRGVAIQDLVQEGACGLVQAVEKYDASKGAKFSSYATFWIQKHIRQSIYNDSRSIRLPRSFQDKLLHLKKAYKSIFDEYGRIATLEELSEATGFDQKVVEHLIVASKSVQSLDMPVDGDGGQLVTELDRTEWEGCGPEDTICREMIREGVHDALNAVLSEREKEVILLKYGLSTEGETRSSEIARRCAPGEDLHQKFLILCHFNSALGKRSEL